MYLEVDIAAVYLNVPSLVVLTITTYNMPKGNTQSTASICSIIHGKV